MKHLLIAAALLFFPATSALAGEVNAGTPGQHCSTQLQNLVPNGCPADCDRAYSLCRATYPFPADAPAERLFRLIDTTGNGSLSSREVAIWGIRSDAAKGLISGDYSTIPPKRLNDAASMISGFDRNGTEAGDGHLARREAIRYAAMFYNRFSGDDLAKFVFPKIKYPSGAESVDPRNPLSAPYLRVAQYRMPTYAEFRRKHPDLSIPHPSKMGGYKDGSEGYVSPYSPGY